jgi:hypothetical protein
MDHTAHASRTPLEPALQSQALVIEELGGERLTGSGFETEEPRGNFDEGI